MLRIVTTECFGNIPDSNKEFNSTAHLLVNAL